MSNIQLYLYAFRSKGQHAIRVDRGAQGDYKAAVFDEDTGAAPRRLITIMGCQSRDAAFAAAERWLYAQQERASWRVRRDIRLGKYA